MEESFVPFRGIKNDLKGRLMCYKQDWTGGLKAGFRFPLFTADHIYSSYNLYIYFIKIIIITIFFFFFNIFICIFQLKQQIDDDLYVSVYNLVSGFQLLRLTYSSLQQSQSFHLANNWSETPVLTYCNAHDLNYVETIKARSHLIQNIYIFNIESTLTSFRIKLF